MNSKTRSLIQEIQNKTKTPITGQKEFANEDAVIDYAVRTVYDQMKKQRVLWVTLTVWIKRMPIKSKESFL